MSDKTMDAALATSEECGCAPSAAERQRFWKSESVTRRNALALGALSVVALSSFGVATSINAAHAASYPSWDDVQNAKANEAAKAGEITRIQGLIQSLTEQAAQAQAAAEAAGNEFYAAQQAYFEQATKAEELQAQADEKSALADETAKKATQVATSLYRNGGDAAALELFFAGSAEGADDLLSRLGTMDRLLEYNRTVYDDAVLARNSAQQLSDQAAKARDERDRLQQIAEEKMIKAQQAADAAQAALLEKQNNLITLQAQLAALQDNTAKTVAGYQAGVEAERQRQEALRQAELKRQRDAAAAAAAAQQQQQQNNGGGAAPATGGGGGGGGGSGWTRPHGGRISSGYGPRPSTCQNGKCGSSWHLGLDFANGCGAAIYAAAAGTVVYSGWNGGYGQYIKIDHGGGTGTGYAHISTLLVGYGARVSAGQVIAYAGNTGNSLGCHLHFEVYVSGGTTDPYPFLANRGAI